MLRSGINGMLALMMALGFCSGAMAGPLDFRPATPGGQQQIYDLDGGTTFLALWGFSGGVNVGDVISTADLDTLFVGNTPDAYYYGSGITFGGTGAWAGSPAEFTQFIDPTEVAGVNSGGTVAGQSRFFDSVWVEFTGGIVVGGTNNSQPCSGSTGTVNCLSGDPRLIASDVPAPGVIGLMGLGLAIFASGRLRRQRVAG